VIAGPARQCGNLQPLALRDDIAVEVRILTSRRTDLVAEAMKANNRLDAQLGEYFLALENTLDYSNSKVALILLTGNQTCEGLRRTGAVRLAAWLRKRKASNLSIALVGINGRHNIMSGQHLAARMVARLT
jgi:hypothetical protein